MHAESSAARLVVCQRERSAVLLAIETSCDETAAAVVRDGRSLLSNVIHSQIDLHREYGGVVPELASRSHVEMIGPVVRRALEEADTTLDDIDAIAVTNGPGLIGCLLVGVSYAKGLALAKGLPLVPVQHIVGHIYANFIAHPTLAPPFVCLVASGGHSHIVAVDDYGTLRLLGRTRDDAAGEAFDKAARALGLPYPGGPSLEALARDGDPEAFSFHSAFNAASHYDVSFSGLKTAVINQIHNASQKGEAVARADLAASFQKAVADILATKAVRACVESGYNAVALAGGVAANRTLRETLESHATQNGLAFYAPPMALCTDNAAMIGCAGYYALMAGETAGLDLNAQAGRKL